MFTGIVQGIGIVEGSRDLTDGKWLRINTPFAKKMKQGDSLAVNGVCLTATSLTENSVEMTAVEETIKRTTLGQLGRGMRVNLECALALGEPLGGHLMQGHVDEVGHVAAWHDRSEGAELWIECSSAAQRYLVTKGSIAIDGVSLTVVSPNAKGFHVAVIPHTLAATVLKDRCEGDAVNLEFDVMGKYVARYLETVLASEQKPRQLTEEFLRERGFI